MFFLLTRRSHEAIIAAKDETIAILKGQLAATNELALAAPDRIAESIAALAENIKPEPLPPPPTRAPREERKTATPVDYASLDAFDEATLTRLALAELGPASRNSGLFLRKRKQVQQQILDAQKGKFNTIPDPEAETKKKVDDLIAAAEKGQ